jgi:predicted  nucleic acid-binding Zn-ribbon protein
VDLQASRGADKSTRSTLLEMKEFMDMWLGDAISRFENARRDLAALDTDESEIVSLHADVARLESELAEARAGIVERDEQLAEQGRRIAELESAAADAEAAIRRTSELETENAQLKEARQKLQSTMDEFGQLFQRLKT